MENRLRINLERLVEEIEGTDVCSSTSWKPLFSNMCDFPNLYLDHEITSEEFSNAINVILTAFIQQNITVMHIDLDERNRLLAPKDMTLEEIEKELGYRVNIIDQKED